MRGKDESDLEPQPDKPLWHLPEGMVTPERDYLQRRRFLRLVGLGAVGLSLLPSGSRASTIGFPDALNPAFKLDGVKLTAEDLVTSYNNFYEWGFSKDEPARLANT